MRTSFKLLSSCASLVLASTAADATVVNFSGSDGSAWVKGSFSYDPNEPPRDAEDNGDSQYAQYSPNQSLYSFSFTSSISGGLISSDDVYPIFVVDYKPNDHGGEDGFTALGYKSLDQFDSELFTFTASFAGANNLTSAALPKILPGSAAVFSEMGQYGQHLDIPVIYSVTSVPETATWGMMILGFVGMGAAMRYRRKSTRVAFA
jgi:hypothetical protein